MKVKQGIINSKYYQYIAVFMWVNGIIFCWKYADFTEMLVVYGEPYWNQFGVPLFPPLLIVPILFPISMKHIYIFGEMSEVREAGYAQADL